MKKIILFIALMTMTLSFAQSKQVDKILDNSKDGVSTAYNDSKQAVSTVYNDIKSLSPKVESAIKSLATELKTTTNALWIILVRQQLVLSIGFLILTLSALLNWFIFYKRYLNKLNKNDFIIGKKPIFGDILNTNYDRYYTKYDDDIRGKMYIKSDTPTGEEDITLPITNPNNIWFKYLHLIICIGLSGLSIWHFSDMLTGFINPEFGALKTIVEVATKLK